jgi:hypothetical protein
LDAPKSYYGQQGKAVVVNATEDGVEFMELSTSAHGGTFANPTYDAEIVNVTTTTVSLAKLIMLS